MANKLVRIHGRLPKGIIPKAPTPGTRAYEYLTGQRATSGLLDDSELLFVIDDKHPDGGLLYVFKDHSSVAYKPTHCN